MATAHYSVTKLSVCCIAGGLLVMLPLTKAHYTKLLMCGIAGRLLVVLLYCRQSAGNAVAEVSTLQHGQAVH